MSLIKGRNSLLVDTLFYTEGPVLSREGNLYFTMLSGGQIMQLDAQGNLTEWAQSTCPNGQYILENGEHWVCDSKLGKVVRFSTDGTFLGNVNSDICAGLQVNVPNDLVVDKKGDLYFTDSIRHKGSVFKISKQGEEELIATGLDYPNGLVLTEDESCLFVAESYKNRILCFDLTRPPEKRAVFEVFIELPFNVSGEEIGNLPDGIALNSQGLMAVAHYGMQAVQIISPDGHLLASYDSGMPCTSNVFFVEDHTLIVTGGFSEPGPGAVFKLTI